MAMLTAVRRNGHGRRKGVELPETYTYHQLYTSNRLNLIISCVILSKECKEVRMELAKVTSKVKSPYRRKYVKT